MHEWQTHGAVDKGNGLRVLKLCAKDGDGSNRAHFCGLRCKEVCRGEDSGELYNTEAREGTASDGSVLLPTSTMLSFSLISQGPCFLHY